MSLQDFIREIDFALLCEQKQTLIRLIDSTPIGERQDHLCGILSLIDNLQDAAVTVPGWTDAEVFGR